MLDLFGKFSQPTQIIIGLSLVAVVISLDYKTGVELSFSIFYFLPIVLVSWYLDMFTGIIFSVLCAMAWAFAELFGGHDYSSWYVFGFNTLVRLFIFLTIAYLIARLKNDSVLLKKSDLLAQRSHDVITTSQRITALLAKGITTHNTRLHGWIVHQRQQNQVVPKVVEDACQAIGSNLAVLTEVCFGYHERPDEPVNLEKLVDSLGDKLNQINQDVADHDSTGEIDMTDWSTEMKHLFKFHSEHTKLR